MNPQWLEKYKPLSDVLMEYGWFVAPFLVGWEFKGVEAVVEHIKTHPPANPDDRLRIEAMIHQSLCDTVFDPGYRARPIWVGLRLDHFREYSHIYESGIFSYYKRDYIGAILCLLAALEGILLSFYGWTPASPQRKPKFAELTKMLRGTTLPYDAPAIGVMHDMYRDTFVEFLDRWLYKNTEQSDFSLSTLNRHFIFHGLEPGNFYRPQDVHRLILAFDLLVELLAARQRIFYVFLPDPGKDEIIDKRRAYYSSLALGAIPAVACWKAERELLKDHPRYVAPDHDPNLAESVAGAAEQFERIRGLRPRPSAPPPKAD